MRRLKEDLRLLKRRQRRQSPAPSPGLRRKKAPEGKAIRGQAGDGKGRHHRRRPRHRNNRDPLGPGLPHQAIAWIGDQRCARITHERNIVSRPKLREQLGGTGFSVVLMIGEERNAHPKGGQQRRGASAILHSN